MIIKGLTVGLLQENCYVLGCEETHKGVIIDPGDNAQAIMMVVNRTGLEIEKIINTHAHFDHVMAVNEVKDATGATFHLHEADLPILRDAPERVSMWLGAEIEPIYEPDEFLVDKQIIRFGFQELEVRFTPGHAPGHVVFVDHRGRQVFAGDTLFRESIGRFDLPLSDGHALLLSIRQQLMSLPDDYRVHPGHGPETTIGHERVYNPYVGQAAPDMLS
jgi:glyoxylase-like metal-dependent hydrolase (beta-lactamase superfamily II)